MRFHGLPQTAAELASLGRVNLRVGASGLGHNDVETTSEIYTRITEQIDEEAAELHRAAIRSKKGTRAASHSSSGLGLLDQ